MKVESHVGQVVLGDGRIAIQSMFKKPLASYDDACLERLFNMGCDIMRFSISNESEDDIREFVMRCAGFFPIVSDIQGSVSQAVASLRAGCAGVRLNPANFKMHDLEAIADLAGEKSAAIRIGINEGSLKDKSESAVFGLLDSHVGFFEKRGFRNLVLSIKSSDFLRTVFLNRMASDRYPYPMHVGLTEAGGICSSAVRTTLALHELVGRGRVDTIRYSISGDEFGEVRCAYEFLRTLGLRKDDFQMVSCPMCARAGTDTEKFGKFVEDFVFSSFNVRELNLKIAVMGCPVNGIGEAEGADVAVCATKSEYIVFESGKRETSVRELSDFKALLSEAIRRAASRTGEMMEG